MRLNIIGFTGLFLIVACSFFWIGFTASQYQITRKANCDGTLKPAECDVILKLPKTYCAGTDERGVTFYYDGNIVNRIYLR